MINKMPTKGQLKDEFSEVLTKLLGKGKAKGRRNTTVNALIDLYKFNPDTATGEKYEKLMEKLKKYSEKTVGNSALFQVPTTRADINTFIEQQILPMKNPDTFAQSVEDLIKLPSSPTAQSTTTRAERMENRASAGAGAGAGAQEEEKEDINSAVVVSKPSYAGVAKRAQDREKIVRDYLALQREESERDNVEALAYLAEQQDRQALDEEALTYVRTRADRVADNSLLPTERFTNLPAVVEADTGGNVPTLQQGTTSAQSDRKSVV